MDLYSWTFILYALFCFYFLLSLRRTNPFSRNTCDNLLANIYSLRERDPSSALTVKTIKPVATICQSVNIFIKTFPFLLYDYCMITCMINISHAQKDTLTLGVWRPQAAA